MDCLQATYHHKLGRLACGAFRDASSVDFCLQNRDLLMSGRSHRTALARVID